MLYLIDANQGNVTLKWVAPASTVFGEPADFDHVRIKATLDGTALAGSPFNADSASSAYVVEGLDKNVEYVFKLFGVDSDDDESDRYEEVTLTIIDNTAPPSHTDVSALSPGSNTVKLSWTNPVVTDFAGTRIKYYRTSTPDIVSINNAGADEQEIFIYDLVDLVEYTFEIQAFDDQLNFSSQVTITGTASA